MKGCAEILNGFRHNNLLPDGYMMGRLFRRPAGPGGENSDDTASYLHFDYYITVPLGKQQRFPLFSAIPRRCPPPCLGEGPARHTRTFPCIECLVTTQQGGTRMTDHIGERACNCCVHDRKPGHPVRAAAKKFGISKSTVHKDLSQRLPQYNQALYEQVKVILDTNKAQRHIRGQAWPPGKSTRENKSGALRRKRNGRRLWQVVSRFLPIFRHSARKSQRTAQIFRHFSHLRPSVFVQNHIGEKIFVRHMKNLEIPIDGFEKVDYTQVRHKTVRQRGTAQEPSCRRFLLCTIVFSISLPVPPPCRSLSWRRSGTR